MSISETGAGLGSGRVNPFGSLDNVGIEKLCLLGLWASLYVILVYIAWLPNCSPLSVSLSNGDYALVVRKADWLHERYGQEEKTRIKKWNHDKRMLLCRCQTTLSLPQF